MYVPKQKNDEKLNNNCDGGKDNSRFVNEDKAAEVAQDKSVGVDSNKEKENLQDVQNSALMIQVNPILGLQSDPVDLMEDSDVETKFDESIHPDSLSFVPNSVQTSTPLDHTALSHINSSSVYSTFVPNSSVLGKDSQVVLHNTNVKVANDMQVIGRLWSDDVFEDQEVEVTSGAVNVDNSADNFTTVLISLRKRSKRRLEGRLKGFLFITPDMGQIHSLWSFEMRVLYWNA